MGMLVRLLAMEIGGSVMHRCSLRWMRELGGCVLTTQVGTATIHTFS